MEHGLELEHGHAAPHEHAHPGPAVYVRVAIFLAIITIVEVAIYYIQWMHDSGLIVPSLLILSAIKFVAVVGYFMHLKFDDRLFLWIFGFALAIAASIVLALYAIFHFHGFDYARALLP
jgi:cytochrome c oxidase subunit 4